MIKKVLLGLALISSVSHAEFFAKGNTGLGLIVGGGSLTVGREIQNYTIVGVSADYFVIDNLSVGLGYMGWFGGTPSLSQVTLPVTYYIPATKKLHPYGGLFLRETFVSDGYGDYESYGVRAGVAITLSSKSYLGVGMVQEYYGSGRFQESSSYTYPEFVFSFSF